MEKKKEQAKVLSQEMLADGIYSLWIETEAARTARPGQFVSVYTADASKLLPRPISICEIDKEAKKLRLVYRVTGEKTGTKQFSELKAGDTVPVIGPLGNGFPYEKAEGKKVFLMGGGIGVPPILELAKQMQCEEKQIVVGYRDAHTFLKDEFEQNGTLYLHADRHQCCGRSRLMQKRRGSNAIFLWKREWHAESEPVWHVSARQRKKMHTAT